MSKERITVTCLAAGQPRPYADSIYRYIMLIEWQGMAGYKNPDASFEPRDLVDAVARRIANGVTRGWKENPQWHEARLRKFNKVAPGTWEIEIVEPYLD